LNPEDLNIFSPRGFCRVDLGAGTTSLLLNPDQVSMATVRVTNSFSSGNFALVLRSLTVMCSDFFVPVTDLATLLRVT
jgi:hypothetical protein